MSSVSLNKLGNLSWRDLHFRQSIPKLSDLIDIPLPILSNFPSSAFPIHFLQLIEYFRMLCSEFEQLDIQIIYLNFIFLLHFFASICTLFYLQLNFSDLVLQLLLYLCVCFLRFCVIVSVDYFIQYYIAMIFSDFSL